MSTTATTTVAVQENPVQQQQADASAKSEASKKKITIRKPTEGTNRVKEAPKDRTDGSNNTRKLQAKAKMKKASEFEIKDGTKKKATGKKATAKPKTETKAAAKKKGTDKEEKSSGGPTQKELKVLGLIKDKPLTRKELSFKTGTHKGWSKLLGAPGKEIKPDTMQGKGWITQEGSPLEVAITKEGKKVLDAYKKAEAVVDATKN